MSLPDTLDASGAAAAATACRHCGTAFEGAGEFCCTGCGTVFALLQAGGLSEYYDIKGATAAFSPGAPVAAGSEAFGFLDSPELGPLYLDGAREVRFFVEGIHCVACLWLLERLPKLEPAAEACRLDMSQSVLTVRAAAGGRLSRVAAMLQRLGYRPHPLRADEGAEALQERERRRSLLRMGLAGGCTGNLMLMAVPLYGGATGAWATAFRWISLGLFLPVAAYAAVPFYTSALGALRARRVNIDVPIVLALVLGSAVSVLNLVKGSAHIYFDSLAALVFLLLASRHYLRQVQARAARTSQLLQNFFAPVAHRLSGGRAEDVPPERLRAGDAVRVEHGERLPADGTVLSGPAQINAAWLTGESMPVEARTGEPVYAGTVNEGPAFELRVTQPVAGSRLGQILSRLETGGRSPLVGLTDRVARHFLAAVMVLAAGVFLAFIRTNVSEGLDRALSLLIVTCPCALALATPLTFSHALGRAYGRGHVVKSGEALERLSEVDEVLFDKTGTLTRGELAVDRWEDLAGNPARNRSLVLGLEQGSLHPVARALCRHLEGAAPALLHGVEERVGEGVRGMSGGVRYAVRAVDGEGGPGTCVGLHEEGRLLARIRLTDRMREDAGPAVRDLQALGCRVRILSGDAKPAVEAVACELELDAADALGRLSPEQKRRIVEASPRAMVVGDGANDALALQGAHVGVAMHGGMDLSLKVADVYLSRPDLGALAELVVLGRETRKVLRRNFALSIGYNAVGGALALMGWINPLAAAVLMPLSSITVLLSSTLSTRTVRRAFRREGR